MAAPGEGDLEELREEQKEQLYRIRRTVMEMLHDRGYLITDADLRMTFREFQKLYETLYRSTLSFSTVKRDDHNKKISVFFVEKQLGKDNFLYYIHQMRTARATNGIFVVKEKPSAYLTDIFGLSTGVHLEAFMDSELIVNISKHVLAPKHEALTSHEKQALLRRKNVTLNQLPRILETDPQARYLGLKPGDVVKITPQSRTGGSSVAYRVVVPDF